MANPRGVDAVERALSIVDCFAPAEGPLSLADLARRTGLYKSTILRLAVSLERFGYVVREDTGQYRLGPAAWRIGAAYRESFDIGVVIQPELKQLSEMTGETASFYVREGETRICLFRVEPVRAIRHTLVEGAPLELRFGATGKILTAFSGEKGAVYDRIRKDGHAISRGERDPEVGAVAVPIVYPSKRLAGALALSGPITRFATESSTPLIATLRAARLRIETQLVE